MVDLSDSHIDPTAVVIEGYASRPRSAAMQSALDEIFFTSSSIKEFADDDARAKFRHRWLGRYLENWPELTLLAIAWPGTRQEVLAGYLVGCLIDPATLREFDDIGYFRALAPVTARFPAHLHINLAAPWRGYRIGQRLVERFTEIASAARVPGVHVVTAQGMRNVKFYRQCGFVEAACASDDSKRKLLLLTRDLSSAPPRGGPPTD